MITIIDLIDFINRWRINFSGLSPRSTDDVRDLLCVATKLPKQRSELDYLKESVAKIIGALTIHARRNDRVVWVPLQNLS